MLQQITEEFLKKAGKTWHKKGELGPYQSHFNQSRLWSRLHTILAQITRITPKWIYTEYTVLKIFSLFRILEQFGLAWKTVSPENFNCIEYISYHSGVLSNSALAVKNRVCPEIFHCIEYTFYIQDFWVTCACPEKQRVPWIHCIEYIFLQWRAVRFMAGEAPSFSKPICERMNWME